MSEINSNQFSFIEKSRNIPLYTAFLPEGYNGEAIYKPIQYTNRDTYKIYGRAVSEDQKYQFYFRTGEDYAGTVRNNRMDCGFKDEDGVIQRSLCPVNDQINEYASELLNKPVTTRFFQPLTKPKLDQIQPEGVRQIRKIYDLAWKVAAMQSVPLDIQVLQTINDGATGIFHLGTEEKPDTILVSLWRFGLDYSFSVKNAAMYGPAAAMQPPVRAWSWTIPMITYMRTTEPLGDEAFFIYYRFLESLKETGTMSRHRERLEEQNLQRGLQKAAFAAQQNQQQINMMWQQQQQAWAMSDALSKQISADLDSFHQNIHQQAQAYDNAHPLYSNNGSSESLDDRIQRQRHEAMMGVDTYIGENGNEVEHTIMNDRVFENNLDSQVHFGTEHYYDDYVPDGWHEIFRKK